MQTRKNNTKLAAILLVLICTFALIWLVVTLGVLAPGVLSSVTWNLTVI